MLSSTNIVKPSAEKPGVFYTLAEADMVRLSDNSPDFFFMLRKKFRMTFPDVILPLVG